MKYSVAEIEDQILTTLRAGISGTTIETHAGEVNELMFKNAAYLEGFITRLPFVLVQYQGRTADPLSDRNSIGTVYFHKLRFRLFVGALSLRRKKESQRDAYTMLASIYDSIHGKWPNASDQTLASNIDKLDGTQITTAGFRAYSGVLEAGGDDERLLVNLPEIVVYQTDYVVRLQA